MFTKHHWLSLHRAAEARFRILEARRGRAPSSNLFYPARQTIINKRLTGVGLSSSLVQWRHPRHVKRRPNLY